MTDEPDFRPQPGVDLVIRAAGPATTGGRLPLSELARLAGGLQASLERIALSISGATARPGRRPRDIVDAVRLDVVGFSRGSAVLEVARTGQLPIMDDLFEAALGTLETGIQALAQNPATPPPHFTAQVVNGLRDLTGGISGGGVSRIEFWGADGIRFTLDSDLQSAVRQVAFESVQEWATIVGRLHMGDFSPAGLRCRVDTYAGSVLCDFTPELRDAVLDAMDQMVTAAGRSELDPSGSSVRILHLAQLETLKSSRPRSLDTLAREQGVRPVTSLSDLAGPPIDDFEDFMTVVRSARQDVA